MNVTPNSILIFGVIVVAVALVVLLLVHRDLRLISGLVRYRHWLLVAALGSGVAAFALKLLFIVAIGMGFKINESQSDSVTEIEVKQSVPAKPLPRYRWQELGEDNALYSGVGGYRWQALPETVSPMENDATACAKAALGEQLFFDTRLSRDRTLSCASCHDVRSGAGHDGLPTAIGIEGKVGRRNTPTVWNAAFQARLFWDGRAYSLEEQAMGPMVNPVEMGMPSLGAVVERVSEQADYRQAFARIYGTGRITIEQIGEAIAAFERTLITPDTPYDRFVRGDLDALTPAQLRGMALFASVGCINCHYGPNFSAASLFNDGAPLRLFPAIATPYEKRYRLTEDRGAATDGERGVWRVPSLRNVALTAPYFHNGSVAQLKEAVRVMANVQLGRTGRMLVWSDEKKRLAVWDDRALGEEALDDIVAFLEALSSDRLVALQKGTDISRQSGLSYARYDNRDDNAAETIACE